VKILICIILTLSKFAIYRQRLANKKEVPPSQITIAEISEARAADSTRALERRNQVLFQWLKNSNDENKSIIMRKTNWSFNHFLFENALSFFVRL
jgi:hypothetical protein